MLGIYWQVKRLINNEINDMYAHIILLLSRKMVWGERGPGLEFPVWSAFQQHTTVSRTSYWLKPCQIKFLFIIQEKLRGGPNMSTAQRDECDHIVCVFCL